MKIKKHCSFIITSIVSFIMFTMVFDFFTVSAKGGISLSGQVISVNPHSETSVLLKQKDEVKYSTVIVGSDNVIQSFSFQGILPGTYDIVVTKSGCLSYTVKGVVVSNKDIDLSKSSEAYRIIELISGDVNEDGFVNGNDVQIIRLTTNINHKTEEAANMLSDINGDGVINGTDVQIVRLKSNINKSKNDSTYDYVDKNDSSNEGEFDDF